MLHFRGADAERQRAESSVGRGMGIAADHRHAWQDRTLLWSDDVNNALTLVGHTELGDAELAAVAVQGLDLQPRHRIGNARHSIPRRNVVIGRR